MSVFAYRNNARTMRVSAEEALRDDRSKVYYCLQKDCDARLHVVDGMTPYFAANSSFGHRTGCIYASNRFDSSRYDTKDFDVEYFVSKLLLESGGSDYAESKRGFPKDVGHSTVLPIRTLKVLYDICKSYKIDDYINQVSVSSLLLDGRTFLNYPIENGRFRIVECRTKQDQKIRYDKEKQTIVVREPNSHNRIILNFNNRDLFWETKDKMYLNSSCLFVVAGIWEKGDYDNSHACNIVNKRQVLVIK